jgi:hypothetical protein
MIEVGQVISYLDMCREENVSLQRGMNYRTGGNYSIILMSLRQNAPYADRVEENGRVLIYEGHDAPKNQETPNPKAIDQPMFNPGGSLTQNGQFYEAALKHKNGKGRVELVKVYEKIRNGIWVYNGIFNLVDAWQEESSISRKVFKFKLAFAVEIQKIIADKSADEPEQDRLIPSWVKLEVWKRDKGQCSKCGSKQNLHFDHIIPYSRGGSSSDPQNIQILCAKHNLEKRDKIE